VSEMSSKNCFNVFRALVLFAALADVLLNIFCLFSSYMSKRDGTYNRYFWQWNAFFVARLVTSAIVLYGVIKSSLRLLIVASVLNGLIFGVLLYAVSVAKFSYNHCERNLCRLTENCDVCYLRNYNDYHLTSKWASKLESLRPWNICVL
jgi:amino acid transporter